MDGNAAEGNADKEFDEVFRARCNMYGMDSNGRENQSAGTEEDPFQAGHSGGGREMFRQKGLSGNLDCGNHE